MVCNHTREEKYPQTGTKFSVSGLVPYCGVAVYV